MSDQFQHVMVLTSIIIGRGITNLLLGLSGAIERFTENSRPLRISWATVFWSAYLFLFMVLFWWWEFRLLANPERVESVELPPHQLLCSGPISSGGPSYSQRLGQGGRFE
jgi:hypothetical protein